MPKRGRIDLDTDSENDDFVLGNEMESDMDNEFESDSEADIAQENDIQPEMDNEFGSDFDSVDILQFVQSFSFLLRAWAVEYNVSHMALTFLLKLLRKEGHIELPKASRTLLRTPKNVKVTNIGKGRYWYRSLKDKLSDVCEMIKCPSVLKLSIHIDGLPPYRSSKLEFWPIQCSIKGVNIKPFFVGLHLGRSKPTSVEMFLRSLLDNLHDLLENGLGIG